MQFVGILLLLLSLLIRFLYDIITRKRKEKKET